MNRGLARSREGIQHLHASLVEVARVLRGGGEIVLERHGSDQVGHASRGTLMSSVVSLRSIGSNQPLIGQASSSFTNPSLRCGSLRFNRYSPRSIRSTSNTCPDLMPSRCRISAGRMIWPFVETVVFTLGKIMSYLPKVNSILVGQFIETMKEFSPRQKPSSFSIGEVMEKLLEGAKGRT